MGPQTLGPSVPIAYPVNPCKPKQGRKVRTQEPSRGAYWVPIFKDIRFLKLRDLKDPGS